MSNFSIRKYPKIDFIFLKEVTSTNDYCKALGLSPFNSPTIVISEVQTAGRGTKGRSWSSSNDKGLWFSILIKPEFSIEDLTFVPIMTSLAICEALETFDVKAFIKWPNDIYVDNKKLCGILTESNICKNNLDYVVIGIGINTNSDLEDFNDDIIASATSLKLILGKEIDKIILLDIIIEKFNYLYSKFISLDKSYILNKYNNKSLIFNKEVNLISKNTSKIVIPLATLEDGSLLVKNTDSSIEKVVASEISLRL